MARGVKLFIDSYSIGSSSLTSQQFSTIFLKTTILNTSDHHVENLVPT